ncbi:MAG: hypothetical protein DMF57_12245 [Acidobacteria bacterium]|nr:MAG: hypothetical protein DMF57_12245 [Acidobacteriota bacterium]
MRFRLISISALFFFATAVFAKDVYLSIGGSVNNFRTDMRIFNPSSTKDIQIQAYLLPLGSMSNLPDNSSVQPKTITVAKRQMLDFDDVVVSLFNGSGTAGIRLKSDDDFVATQRIYALVNGDTLGQFVPGLDVTSAKKQGVLIQLKANGGPGQKGTFRTNIGAVNPNSTAASVTWRLYDKNNALVGTPKTFTMPPFSVLTPTSLSGFSDGIPAAADFSDAWASYVSDQQIFAYASVIDNGSTDPTFIPMSEDTGVPPTAKTFDVTVQNFSITISPAPNTLKVGDQVIFHITVSGSNHGFELDGPNGSTIIPGAIFSPGTIVDKTFTVPSQGTYNYFCTNSGCGAHTGMLGSFDVGNPTNDPGGPHY